ncbi:hypothetical protein Cni_G05491 [Canna indica]|uniref:Uncharacterized protein n=1 Tax=Canna indica TaxID=4628 RepID=A0AAQ3JUU6_9LILI|nr:hypothetical protein Cni_G05491 [Canna indica]
MAQQCYNSTTHDASTQLGNGDGATVFSVTRNKFTVVGCATLAYINGRNDQTKDYASGCVSICKNREGISKERTCNGMGCCQTSIPRGLNLFNVSFDQSFDSSAVADFSPCSYAFLAEQDWFQFDESVLSTEFGSRTNSLVRVVLDWAVRQGTCEDAKLDREGYFCRSDNSNCTDATNGSGYLCHCSPGYEGNPYLDGIDGCKDIDECKLEHPPCYGNICTNTPGSYNCTCPEGTDGDPTKSKCTAIDHGGEKIPLQARLAIGKSISITSVILAAMISYTIIKCQRMRHKKEKDSFFQKNGGFKLYEEMVSRKVDTIQVFTEEELKRATNNFDDKEVIGRGGHGMVYKGILYDGRIVAIKKSKIIDADQKDEFINEIIVLSQINHRNVVRLLGCCLEINIPMLVYEYIPKGSLFNVMFQGHCSQSPLPLETRLRLAEQAAEALAYLHSGAARPIIHGDVKSQNILLGDNFMAKVSDFGASQLVPMDETGFIAFVQGTFGYLDPECLQTRRLTDRSDVYSFGVVLLELITGKAAIYYDELGEKRCLASSFIMKVKEHKVRDILDDQMVEEGGWEIVGEVANIAKECLMVAGEDRPAMKGVAERLHALRRFKLHPWKEDYPDEIESLLGEPIYNSKAHTGTFHSLDEIKIDASGR